MADRYLGVLKKTERQRTLETSLLFDADEGLDRLTEAMSGQIMSVNDYLKLLSLIYEKYGRRKTFEKGQAYILYRMESVMDAREHRHLRRRYPKLTDFDAPLDDSVKEFLQDKPSRWGRRNQAIMKRLLWVDLILYILLLVLLVFALKMSFLTAFVICLAAWLSLLGYFWLSVMPQLAREQLAKLAPGLDPLLLQFEKAGGYLK